MKKDNVELEKFMFIGDSDVNEVICIKSDGSKAYCTQTDLIAALTQNKKHIKGGSKLKLSDNDKKISYLINYGNNENEPKELIKITFDKNNLLKGDPNALAIDSICNNAITVGKKNIKKLILSGTAAALVGAGLAGAMFVGFAYASKKEQEYQNQETKQYKEWLEYEKQKEKLGLNINDDALEINESDLMGKHF